MGRNKLSKNPKDIQERIGMQFNVRLKPNQVDQFKDVCNKRQLSYVRGIREAVNLWLAYSEEKSKHAKKKFRKCVCNIPEYPRNFLALNPEEIFCTKCTGWIET